MFHGLPYPDRPHFSAFSWAACDAAYRNPEVFASSPDAVDLEGGEIGPTNSMLSMGGAQHRRYRGLVQPSFSPTKVLVDRELDRVHRPCPDRLVRGAGPGRVERRVLRGHPGPHDHRQLRPPGRPGPRHSRVVGAARADHGDPRSNRRRPPRTTGGRLHQRPRAVRDHRRGWRTHRLTDAEIYSFSLLLLAAGSGTTWKQMGITLAALLQRPELLDAVRSDRSLLRSVIEESLRWEPTDPMFSRWVTEDTDFFGTQLPKGAVLHICLGAANRDPERWEHPDEYRPLPSHEAHIGLRQRPARLSGAARRPCRDDGRDQRAVRSSPQSPTRSGRRATGVHRVLRAWRDGDSRSCSIESSRA